MGNFTTAGLASWGIGNNQISGMTPATSMEVEVFDGNNFTGSSRAMNTEVICLAANAMGNAASSVKICTSAILFSDTFSSSASAGNWETVNGTWTFTGQADRHA